MTAPLYQLYIGGGGTGFCTSATTAPLNLVTTAAGTPCFGIEVSPISTNTAPVVIGAAGVEASSAARTGYALYASTGGHFFYCRNLNEVYINGVSTQGVSYVYYLNSVP